MLLYVEQKTAFSYHLTIWPVKSLQGHFLWVLQDIQEYLYTVDLPSQFKDMTEITGRAEQKIKQKKVWLCFKEEDTEMLGHLWCVIRWEVIKALKQSRASPSEYANNVCLWGDKTTKLIKICSNSSWGRFFWKASLREEREPLNVCSWTTLFPHWNAQFESYFALYDPNGRRQENNLNTNHRMKLKCWYRLFTQ